MDFANLPYDTHNCQLHLESFLYLAPELRLVVRDNGESFRKSAPLNSNAWTLGERVWKAEVTTREERNFVNGGGYSEICVSLILLANNCSNNVCELFA